MSVWKRKAFNVSAPLSSKTPDLHCAGGDTPGLTFLLRSGPGGDLPVCEFAGTLCFVGEDGFKSLKY